MNGEPIGSLGDGEAVWHTDMSYLDVPPKASMLYALEVPPTGGNTSFCTMYGVYEALPAALKERIAGLKIKHDGTYNSGGYVRQGVTPTDDPRISPGAVHPLVCTHPATGRRMLYLGRRRNAYLVGLELAESEALLDELWEFVDAPQFAWEHVWRVGDLVLWDNRCTMHRRDAFDPTAGGSCTAPRSRASSDRPERPEEEQMRRRDLLGMGLAALACVCLRASRRASPSPNIPTVPIRLVMPFPPGGGYDAVGRPWAERIKPLLGTVVVENQGGGGSSLGRRRGRPRAAGRLHDPARRIEHAYHRG